MNRHSLWLAATLLITGSNAFADQPNYLGLREGTWNFGVDAGAIYSSRNGLATNTTASFRYFPIDRLAIGLELDYYTNIDNSVERLLFGPVVTYYFYTFHGGAFFASQSLKIGKEKEKVFGVETQRDLFMTESRLGVDFHMTPSVSFGPRMRLQQDLKTGQRSLIPEMGLNMSF